MFAVGSEPSLVTSASGRSSYWAVLAIALLCLAVHPARAADAADVGQGAGMRMYRDPASGAIGAPPPAAVIQSAPRAALTESTAPAEPLVEEPVRVPAGGVKVNLRGRFRATVMRHADADGISQNECVETAGAPR